ncbi:MAG: hypothetical protein ACI9WS_001604 [Paraglaciecola psychrophila]|jgi:hypothetical protein
MKHIYTSESIIALYSIKNVLARNDITSFVKNEHSISSGARFGISNLFLELWIDDKQDYAKAKTIIDHEIDNPPQKESWRCTQCGEQNDGNFEVCWQCAANGPY